MYLIDEAEYQFIDGPGRMLLVPVQRVINLFSRIQSISNEPG